MIIDSVRGLMAGPTEAAALRKAGLLNASTGTSTVLALLWIAVILGTAAPTAVRWYRRAT